MGKSLPCAVLCFTSVSRSHTTSNSQHESLAEVPGMANAVFSRPGPALGAPRSCQPSGDMNEAILSLFFFFLPQKTTCRGGWCWVLTHTSTITAPGRTRHPEAHPCPYHLWASLPACFPHLIPASEGLLCKKTQTNTQQNNPQNKINLHQKKKENTNPKTEPDLYSKRIYLEVNSG